MIIQKFNECVELSSLRETKFYGLSIIRWFRLEILLYTENIHYLDKLSGNKGIYI